MTDLQSFISSGVVTRPVGIFALGQEGTGKTGSFVNQSTSESQVAFRSLFLDLEHGSDQYNCDRIHIDNYRQFVETLDLIIRGKTEHQIIVVDPIEIAEKLLIAQICLQHKIDGLHGLGHGAAWQYLREGFDREYMARFTEIRRTGRHMVVIGHTQIRTVTLPGLAEPFEKYEPRIDKRNADTLVEWADHVLFYDWDIRTAKTREGIVRAVSGTQPIVRVVHGPGWIAKNRSGLTEPLKPTFESLAPLFGEPPVIDAERPRAGAGGEVAAPPPSPISAHSPSTTVTIPEAAASPPAGTPAPARPSLEDDSGPSRHYDDIVSDLRMDEIRAADALLSSLPQQRLSDFLRERKLIEVDGDYHDLKPEYVRRILGDAEGFKQAVLS